MKYKNEQGFGIISLIAVIAVSALVAAGAGMASIQIIKGTERNEDLIQAVRQNQNVGRWFSWDAMMADNVTAGDDAGTSDVELLTIYWKDWENGDTFNIRYLWLENTEPAEQVKRSQVIRDTNSVVTSNTTHLIAFGIHSAVLSQQGNTLIMNVEARSGQKSSVQEYRVAKRLN